jgi:vitamin B12 transporter
MRYPLSLMALLLAGTAPVFAQDAGVFDLDEIVFSAGLSPQEAARIGVSLQVVSEEELQQAGNVQLADFLATLPGLSLSQNGPAGTTATLRIRGAGSGLLGVYVDGILVNDPTTTNGGFNGFSNLTTGSIRRVEVLRGSQSATFGGNAVGGVISITTIDTPRDEDGTRQTLSTEVGSFGRVGGAYTLSQQNGPLTLSLGLSHTQADGFSAADEANGNTENDSFATTRLSFGATYRLNPDVTLGFNAFVDDSDYEFDEFAARPTDGTPGDETGSARLTGVRGFAEITTGDWRHNFTVTHLQTERAIESRTVGAETAANFGSPFRSSFDGERTTAAYVLTTEALANQRLSFGIDWREETARYENVATGSATTRTTGGFIENIWSPMDNLDVSASLRVDDSTDFGQETTGRIAFAWRPVENTTLRGAIATGYRPPSIDELFGSYPGAFPFLGNPDLQPEESLSYEIGLERSFANGGSISATLYRLEVDNFIRFRPGTPFSTVVNTPGQTVFEGLELAARYPLGQRVTLTGAYTLTDAETGTGERVARVPRHDLNLSLSTDFTDRLSASVSLRHVADRPNDSGQVMNDYTVVNTSLRYDITDNLEANFRIENLFDEQYQQIAGFGTSGRAFYVGLSSRF